MRKSHSVVYNFLVSWDSFFLIEQIEAIYTKLLIFIVKVPAPEPNLIIFCEYIGFEILGFEALYFAWKGKLYLLYTALFLSAIVIGSIKLPIHSCPEPIQSSILWKQEIMMPSSWYLNYFHIVCKDLNRVLNVNEEGIWDPRLPILIVPTRIEFAWFSQEKRVKFSSLSLNDFLTFEVIR